MAFDLEAIKNKLKQLNNAKKKTSQWKPKMPEAGQEPIEYRIRIVPYKDNDGQPFKELWFYYNIGSGGPILAPKQFGKEDPVQDLIDNLLQEKGNKENWEVARKLFPKMRGFAGIIVRGEESEGVRTWSFSKTIYSKLLSTLVDPEWGDITDPKAGHDIKITFTQQGGKEFVDTSIDFSPKPSPLSKDPKQMQEWLDSVPDPVNDYDQKTKEQIDKRLSDWLNGPSSSDGTKKGPAVKTESKKTDTSTAAADDSSVEVDIDKAFEEISGDD